jgi:hypothetical protein
MYKLYQTLDQCLPTNLIYTVNVKLHRTQVLYYLYGLTFSVAVLRELKSINKYEWTKFIESVVSINKSK